MKNERRQQGFTLIEILSVCVLIAIISAFALPSYMQARRVALEDNAIARLHRIALAESRFYAEYNRFGNFMELVNANYLPRGYSTSYRFKSPVDSSSILPFIERYSLRFIVPNSAASLYYKVDAVPVMGDRMGLRTFNINLFVTGTMNPDQLIAIPPVREGLETDGRIVTDY